MFYLSLTREQDSEILEPFHLRQDLSTNLERENHPFLAEGHGLLFGFTLGCQLPQYMHSGLIKLTGHHLPKSSMTNLSYHISNYQSATVKDSVQGIVKPQQSTVATFLNISRSQISFVSLSQIYGLCHKFHSIFTLSVMFLYCVFFNLMCTRVN